MMRRLGSMCIVQIRNVPLASEKLADGLVCMLEVVRVLYSTDQVHLYGCLHVKVNFSKHRSFIAETQRSLL